MKFKGLYTRGDEEFAEIKIDGDGIHGIPIADALQLLADMLEAGLRPDGWVAYETGHGLPFDDFIKLARDFMRAYPPTVFVSRDHGDCGVRFVVILREALAELDSGNLPKPIHTS